MKKIYSAFVSSAFTSLRDERNQVIDVLLDFDILPIGMEHFTVSTNGNFSDIQEYIDDSDSFIMLLGDRPSSFVCSTPTVYDFLLQTIRTHTDD